MIKFDNLEKYIEEANILLKNYKYNVEHLSADSDIFETLIPINELKNNLNKYQLPQDYIFDEDATVRSNRDRVKEFNELITNLYNDLEELKYYMTIEYIKKYVYSLFGDAFTMFTDFSYSQILDYMLIANPHFASLYNHGSMWRYVEYGNRSQAMKPFEDYLYHIALLLDIKSKDTLDNMYWPYRSEEE